MKFFFYFQFRELSPLRVVAVAVAVVVVVVVVVVVSTKYMIVLSSDSTRYQPRCFCIHTGNECITPSGSHFIAQQLTEYIVHRLAQQGFPGRYPMKLV